jgi:hypothetical protein
MRSREPTKNAALAMETARLHAKYKRSPGSVEQTPNGKLGVLVVPPGRAASATSIPGTVLAVRSSDCADALATFAARSLTFAQAA